MLAVGRNAAVTIISILGVMPVAAQTGPTETLGQITCQITAEDGAIDGEWRLIARAQRDDPDLIGASVRFEDDGVGTMATIRLNAVAMAAPAPAGPLRGNNFLRVDLFFDLPPEATVADLEGAEPVEAGLSFVEVWPSNVDVPALQFTTMFNPVVTEITRAEPVEGGLHLEGRASGRACLFAFHRDVRGELATSEARVMGEQPCADIDIGFSTRVPVI